MKSKQGDREYRAAKEHKEYVEKTETVSKVNRELEEKIEAMKEEIEQDERERRIIQEQFSQDYYIVCRKIENLKEDLKIASSHLSFTLTDQLRLKTEELQKILDTTHQNLLSNEQIVEEIITDTAKAISTLPVEPQLRTNQLGSLSGTQRNTVTAQMTKSAVQNVFRTAAT